MISTSMPLFARLVYDGMTARGHDVEVVSAKAYFYQLPCPTFFKKWLGYIDQYVVFPVLFKLRRTGMRSDALYVFTDQALGPWVPLVDQRAHIVHCHDFIALKSSLGQFPENPVSWTGRQYQAMICSGLNRGRRFICGSARTKSDLLSFLTTAPDESIVVYTGFNYPFQPMCKQQAEAILFRGGIKGFADGFLMHVGGNQWYKNRAGVLALYKCYAERVDKPLPLFLLGSSPTVELRKDAEQLVANGLVRFIVNPDTELVHAAYALAEALVFPSVAEGFGWPIAEALACGCPVLTTDDTPMTEIGGDVSMYVLSCSAFRSENEWAYFASDQLLKMLSRSSVEKEATREAGLAWSQQFSAEQAILGYEAAYQRAIDGGIHA